MGSPATTSRKCPDSTPSVDHCLAVADFVYIPTSTMNTGMRGAVSATMTAASRSWVRIATPTVSGTMTAITSCGKYFATYGSTESTPRVASVAIWPRRSPESHTGPRRTTWSRSAARSCAEVRVAARWESTSPTIDRIARPATTSASVTSTGCTSDSEAPPRKTREITSASANA